MTTLSPDNTLNAIRREIDSIDDQILDLLGRRFAATGRVKASKASDGSIASSPLRPAREAAMLRRLIARGGTGLSPEILLRFWRVILSASTQSQAPVTLHLDEVPGHDLGTRLLLGQHFCGMEVTVHTSPPRALAALHGSQGDLAIIATSSNWVQGFSPAESGFPRVIGTLPVISDGSQPQLLVFGYAEPQNSGDDETLILSPGSAPRFSSALWQVPSGDFTLTSLPGFLDGEDPLLREIISRLPGACIAGRYPRPIKVST
jgi:chorismate mutase/prephenate dehydratase